MPPSKKQFEAAFARFFPPPPPESARAAAVVVVVVRASKALLLKVPMMVGNYSSGISPTFWVLHNNTPLLLCVSVI